MVDEFSKSGPNRAYPHLKYWQQTYAPPGCEDMRAVEAFMECETRESQATLRNELRAISNGLFKQENLDQILGKNRPMKHGSFEAWAKLMLLWMAASRG